MGCKTLLFLKYSQYAILQFTITCEGWCNHGLFLYCLSCLVWKLPNGHLS